jgi:P27 family predicted phage terminase small subunit
MGRPQTPTNILKLKGSDKKDPARMKDRNPPEPKKGIPKPPQWLNPNAKKAFRELAKITDGMNVLTMADSATLALICDAYADYLDAKKLVDTDGLVYTVTNREGQTMMKANPAATIKADAWRRVMAGLGKFGLSPVEREKINITKPKSKNKFDDD